MPPPSRSEQNAIRSPSGENAGAVSASGLSAVRFTGLRPPTRCMLDVGVAGRLADVDEALAAGSELRLPAPGRAVSVTCSNASGGRPAPGPRAPAPTRRPTSNARPAGRGRGARAARTAAGAAAGSGPSASARCEAEAPPTLSRWKARSRADWKRSSGFFSRQWWTMRSSACGIRGPASDGCRRLVAQHRAQQLRRARALEGAPARSASRRGRRRARRCPSGGRPASPRACSGDM